MVCLLHIIIVTRVVNDAGRNWSMQIFSATTSIAMTPQTVSASSLLGQNSEIPTIDFESAADFQTYVPVTPLEYFSWRFFGAMQIISAGSYTICSTSDDGSQIYINSGAAVDFQSNFTLLINDDGLHGATTVCVTRSLQSQVYYIMVIDCFCNKCEMLSSSSLASKVHILTSTCVQVKGFQGCCGLEMKLQYQGPDTQSKMINILSVSSYVPAFALVAGLSPWPS